VVVEGMFKKKNAIGGIEDSTKSTNFAPTKNMLFLPKTTEIIASSIPK
jgi:hypothetical protein